MSKISIALTTYHGTQYLLKQLQSLLRQSRQADEVIICDDCSQDNTVSIVRQFIAEHGLKNWYLYENQHNLGFARNFRKALSLTTGEIVFLCDQDDIWLDNKIETMFDILADNPTILALACSYRLIDGQDQVLATDVPKFYEPKPGTSVLSPVEYGPILYNNIAQGCAGAYRRKLIDAFCSTDDFGSMPHDWALNLMAHQEHGLYFLNKELLLYRIHGQNAIGLGDTGASTANRIPRLRKYAAELESALCLPIPEMAKEEIRAIVEFIDTRLAFLRSKRLSLWIMGLGRHTYVLKQYFFWQYLKDFVLVLLGKIPNTD